MKNKGLFFVFLLILVLFSIERKEIKKEAGGLNNVETWFYFLGFDINPIVNDIVQSDYDLVVIEPIFTDVGNSDYDIASVVSQIKSSPGKTVGNKIVLAYIDIGEAENWRYYWQPDWGIGNPSFIVGEDPDGWEDVFPVAFWYQEWQDIWFVGGNGYDSQLKMLSDAGFDGVYLDWVEAYSDDFVIAKAQQDGKDTLTEIKSFVAKFKQYGTQLNGDFIVIAQNSAELLVHSDYVSSIDGMAQEVVWFEGRADGALPEGDCPTPATEADVDTQAYRDSLSSQCLQLYYDYPESTLHVSTEWYLNYLSPANQAGLPIFTVDYALQQPNIDYAYEQSRAQGFKPFVTNRAVDLFLSPVHPEVSPCQNPADTTPDCSITFDETLTYAGKWINNQGVTFSEFISVAEIWVNGGSY